MPISISRLLSSRDRYRPEGFSPRVDIGRGKIIVLIWKRACINLLITYFNIELNRTKLTSHTDTKLMDMSDRYRLRVLLPKHQQIFPRWTSTQLGGSDVMGLTRGLISCYQSFAPMADIAVALPVFMYGQNWRYYLYICDKFNYYSDYVINIIIGLV
jgi:hypothetical protein